MEIARTATHEPPIYTFRVRIRGGWYAPENCRDIWREIEIAGNQTLEDLGELIPLCFDFYDPHLWSFFLSGKPWDESTEYKGEVLLDMFESDATPASEALIRDVPYPGKTGKREFLYLFDYGDEWHFGVKLLRISSNVEADAAYPRVVASQGASPPQYPHLEEEDWDEEEEEDSRAQGALPGETNAEP